MSGSVKKIVWDKWNKKHIKKHKVTVQEVEEVYRAKKIINESYLGRQIVLGKTKKGRLLAVVLSQEREKKLYVVSARDASIKERKIYYEKTKTH